MFKRLKVNQSYPELMNQYNEYSKQIKADIKKRKLEYYRNRITQSMNNPKMRKTVNVGGYGGRGSGGSWNSIDKITVHEREMVDGEEIAKFFTNIGKKLAEKIKQPLEENVRLPDRVVDSFVLKPTTPKEVMKTIKSLKSKKSFGLDGITTEVLKKNDEL
ncbi:hypothetical protein HHI36_011834, partial [Cryptolaemus montrouzieri]